MWIVYFSFTECLMMMRIPHNQTQVQLLILQRGIQRNLMREKGMGWVKGGCLWPWVKEVE